MIGVALTLALALPQGPSSTPTADEAPVVESWPGTLTEGFARIREHATALQFESARQVADLMLTPTSFLRTKRDFTARGGWRAWVTGVADPALDALGLNGYDTNVRAEIWFARGVVNSLDKQREEAANDFDRVRALASDRALRRDAIYDLGVLSLEAGEEARATIPEISGKPPTPPPPLPPQPAGASGAPPEPPDPLQIARTAYLAAREHFVERLKSAYDDADTQANVELCLKRLRELDEIEKKREEEQQKQDQQQDQDKKDENNKDKQDQQQDSKDQNQKPDSKDEPQPKDPGQDEKPEEKGPDEPKPEDKKPEDKKPDEKKDALPPDPKDLEMSREEMTQLLDRLKELEEESQKIQAQLKAARRGKVKKDW